MALSTVPTYRPTASQFASAALHLERRQDWRFVHIAGERYAVIPSGRSGHVYQVRADAHGCACKWYQSTGQTCAHMLALDLEALQIELEDAAIDAILGPAPKTRYEALFPQCKSGCGETADYRDGYCWGCGSDREWVARRDAAGR